MSNIATNVNPALGDMTNAREWLIAACESAGADVGDSGFLLGDNGQPIAGDVSITIGGFEFSVTLEISQEWVLVDNEWHFCVGEKTVARVTPLGDEDKEHFPQWEYLTIIEDGFDDKGWHAVEFATLEGAKAKIEFWWTNLAFSDSTN